MKVSRTSLEQYCLKPFRLIFTLYKEKRIPWFIKIRINHAVNAFHFIKNLSIHLFKNPFTQHEIITINCGFHGLTGGVYAIANIANILSRQYHVEFVSNITSNYNRLLESTVRIVCTPNMESGLFICDVSCPHSFLEKIKINKKRLIVSCHGFLHECHGLDAEYVKKSLTFSDKVHFVSEVQQESFDLPNNKYFIIPNTTKKINKHIFTNNVGCVGNLKDKRKNAHETVKIALETSADRIHLWGIEENIWGNPKVITHSWENNKEKIYNSFDVLVFLSQKETFGLVVIEAMSAGIPCLLSSIPAFEQFRGCEGIIINELKRRDKAPALIDEMLKSKGRIRDNLIEHYEKNYSETAVLQKWVDMISHINSITS